ncbi:MAG: hypothetical protein EA427_13755 [Spirochaetaceae bacterium]|nr:MAG: hypothetical protein EA427_13755 [Spirochaetaceae bacterium]
MGDIGRGITARNPVWVVPLALPIALFASTTWEMALLFSIGVSVTVIVTHILAIPVERWLPPDLAIVAMLITGGVVITLAERVLYVSGIVPAARPLFLFRAISVSGVMLWPALIGSRTEPVTRRLNRVIGLVLGFVLGLLGLTLLRTSLIAYGFIPAGSLPFGLVVLALGRMAANRFMEVSRERRGGKEHGE